MGKEQVQQNRDSSCGSKRELLFIQDKASRVGTGVVILGSFVPERAIVSRNRLFRNRVG